RVRDVRAHALEPSRAQYADPRRFLGRLLSVYQVPSLTDDSPLCGDVRLQEALAEAAADGVRVGFSTSGPKQKDVIRRAMSLEVDGQRLFSTVQSKIGRAHV